MRDKANNRDVIVPERSDPLIGPYLRYLEAGIAKALDGKKPKCPVWIVSKGGFASVPIGSLVVFVQIEHTVSDSPDPADKTPHRDWSRRDGERPASKRWFLRLLDKERISTARVVIEYSAVNMAHVLASPYQALYKDKAFYIAPFFLPSTSPLSMSRIGARRPLAIQTTNRNSRRSAIVEMLALEGVQVKTLGKVRPDTKSAGLRNRIELNLHQTARFQTFEELRVAAAIQRGNVVVSEPSAFISSVPYRSLVTFCEVTHMPALIATIRSKRVEPAKCFPNHSSRYALIQKEKRKNAAKFAAIASRLLSG